MCATDPIQKKILLLLSTEFNVTPTTGLIHHCWSSHYLNGNRLLIETLFGQMSEDTDEGNGFALVLKELMLFQEDGGSNRRGFGRVLKALISEREKQQSELMAEREKAAVANAILKQKDESTLLLRTQQEEFQLKLQKQQEEFQAKLEQREERLQERLEHERREHNLRQDKLFARHDQERVEAKASQEMLLHKIFDNQRILPPRDENQEGVILEQGRQQTFFREVMQQLREEVKTLRHSESGKSKICQGRVMLKQPDDANRFRSSFDSIHSWRS